MQSVNGAQFSNITFLLVLVTAAPATAALGTVIVPLTSIMYQYNDINLNLSWTFSI